VAATDKNLFDFTGCAKKTWHFTFVRIFANYRSIFKILSLAHSADNLQ